MKREAIAGRRFEVSYTRGDTLATETAVLDPLEVVALGCGCRRVRFERPGGQMHPSLREWAGTEFMQALTGCGVHPAMCSEVTS